MYIFSVYLAIMETQLDVIDLQWWLRRIVVLQDRSNCSVPHLTK